MKHGADPKEVLGKMVQALARLDPPHSTRTPCNPAASAEQSLRSGQKHARRELGNHGNSFAPAFPLDFRPHSVT